MKISPKVTVFIPVHNGEKYLAECLKSVLDQTFSDFECLVFDDCSTDGSAAVVASVPDNRIRYVKSEKNLGIANARNKGLQMARGEYVAFLDCDDVSVPNRLERQVAFMEAYPEVGVCGGYMQWIGPTGELIPNGKWLCPPDHQTIARNLAVTCTLWNTTLIIRKSVVTAHEVYHDPAYVAASDLDWYIRLSRVTQLANLAEVLTYYRKHNDQITSKRMTLSRRNSNNLHLGLMLEEIKKFCPGAKGAVQPVTAQMDEITFFRNLVLVDRLVTDWPAPPQEAGEEYQMYQAIKEGMGSIWRDTARNLYDYTPASFRVVKQSAFFKSLPLSIRLKVWGGSMLGLKFLRVA